MQLRTAFIALNFLREMSRLRLMWLIIMKIMVNGVNTTAAPGSVAEPGAAVG
jgi:hypothetical protein